MVNRINNEHSRNDQYKVLLTTILQANNKHLSIFQGLQLSVRVAKKSGEEGAKFTSTFSAKGLKDKVMFKC